MKNFKVFVILISIYFHIERLRGDKIDIDIVNLREIFDKLQADQGFFSRNVFVEDQNISILNNLKSSISNGLIDSSAITEENVYELSHLTNIVLSCEYSEITYYYIKLIEKCFSGCLNSLLMSNDERNVRESKKLSIINKCFSEYHSTLLDTIIKQISPMILSLTNFIKLPKNVIYKFHDILRILLSWYLYLDQSFKSRSSDENISVLRMSRLESIQLTNFQMKNRLERFLATHCHRPEEILSFINKIDGDIKQLKNPVNYKDLVTNRGDRLKSLSISDSAGVKKKFVINSSDSDFNNLISILKDEVSSKKIKIEWEGIKNIEYVYFSSIKSSIDIPTLLRYEKIILDIVCDIISSYVAKEVKKISSGNNNSDKLNENQILLKTIDNFLDKMKDNDQSLVLILHLMRIKSYLWNINQFLVNTDETKINDIIENFRNEYMSKSFINKSELIDKKELQTFLQIMSETLICAKLHPSISNTFWKQYMVYASSTVAKYGINYQNLHTTYENYKKKNNLCGLISTVSKSLKNIEEQLKKCISKDENNNLVSNDNFDFTTFNQQYDKLITDVADITINSQTYFDDWTKLFLTLYYNKKNIQLFNVDEQKSLDATRRQHLITFMYVMKNLSLENQFVHCKTGLFSDLLKPDNHTEDTSWDDESTLVHLNVNVDHLQFMTELKPVFSYVDSFQLITHSVHKLFTEFKIQLELKLYWEGSRKTLNEVHSSYEMNTFDLQDAYDYASFFIKWVITLMHCKLREVLNLMIEQSRELTQGQILILTDCVDEFWNTPLVKPYVSRQLAPAKFYLQLAIIEIKSFDPTNEKRIENIKNSKNVFQGHLKSLGFVKGSHVNTNKTNSQDIGVLLEDFNQLKLFFNLYVK